MGGGYLKCNPIPLRRTGGKISLKKRMCRKAIWCEKLWRKGNNSPNNNSNRVSSNSSKLVQPLQLTK